MDPEKGSYYYTEQDRERARALINPTSQSTSGRSQVRTSWPSTFIGSERVWGTHRWSHIIDDCYRQKSSENLLYSKKQVENIIQDTHDVAGPGNIRDTIPAPHTLTLAYVGLEPTKVERCISEKNSRSSEIYTGFQTDRRFHFPG